jgi:superoxide dismutase, Fe-Mn family
MTAFAQGPGPRDGVSRPTIVWSDPPSYSAYTPVGTGTGNGNSNGVTDGSSTTLDSLGQTLFPLFCVSVHEHAWTAGGYGVWGKERYLERFWTCLDWEAVRDAYVMYVRPKHY